MERKTLAREKNGDLSIKKQTNKQKTTTNTLDYENRDHAKRSIGQISLS